MTAYSLLNDLKQDIIAKRVILVAGAGVSIAATGSPFASWKGLLGDGVLRCSAYGTPRASPDWVERAQNELTNGDVDELLSVASKVTHRLGGANGGEFRRWMRETIGNLEIKSSDLVDALADLQIPIVTTNYDSLLETATNDPAVIWKDVWKVERVIRGDDRGIVHLHGHWATPDSIVLGVESYETLLGSEAAQHFQRVLATTKSLLFLGYGAGLDDPNFSSLTSWLNRYLSGSEYRHYWVMKADDAAREASNPRFSRLFPVSFGSTWEELSAFMRQLRTNHEAPTVRESRSLSAVVVESPTNVTAGQASPRDVIDDDGILDVIVEGGEALDRFRQMVEDIGDRTTTLAGVLVEFAGKFKEASDKPKVARKVISELSERMNTYSTELDGWMSEFEAVSAVAFGSVRRLSNVIGEFDLGDGTAVRQLVDTITTLARTMHELRGSISEGRAPLNQWPRVTKELNQAKMRVIDATTRLEYLVQRSAGELDAGVAQLSLALMKKVPRE